jgi:hypothetical protein
MDDDSRELLRQILAVQSEQAELLKKYLPPLWTKVRFSLLTLLLAMTGIAVALGALFYKLDHSAATTTTIAPASPPMAPVGPGIGFARRPPGMGPTFSTPTK